MKRRLVLAATALAIIGGSAVAASAAVPSSTQVNRPKPGQVCLLVFYDDGGDPGHLCLNW